MEIAEGLLGRAGKPDDGSTPHHDARAPDGPSLLRKMTRAQWHAAAGVSMGFGEKLRRNNFKSHFQSSGSFERKWGFSFKACCGSQRLDERLLGKGRQSDRQSGRVVLLFSCPESVGLEVTKLPRSFVLFITFWMCYSPAVSAPFYASPSKVILDGREKIVTATKKSGCGSIVSFDTATSETVVLVGDETCSHSPAIVGDRQLFYFSEVGGRTELWVMELASKARRLLRSDSTMVSICHRRGEISPAPFKRQWIQAACEASCCSAPTECRSDRRSPWVSILPRLI
jgi:hypothetical protein